ncbi:Zinc finger domain-containing protein, PHD-finger, partial [Metarhizium majus ARSEF 297]
MTAHSPCQRTAPFLHRTWLKGVRALQESSVMGNIISSPMHKLPHGESGDGPPAKRRRISSPDSLDLDHLVASPRLSESGSTLRIEVLKILHKDSKKVKKYQGTPVPHDILTTKARCKVSMFDMSSGPPQILYCQSQLCDLITFKNPNGPYRIARVDLPAPFFIPRESILINRPDDGTFDLSDSYQLLIELEAANAAHWPPLDEQDFGIPTQSLYPPWGTTRHWILSSRFDSVFGRMRNPLSLSARYPSDQSSYQTNYVMDVDLRWTAGFKALRRLEKGSLPCITAIHPDVDMLSDNAMSHPGEYGINGVNGHADSESPQDQDDELAGDQTPSRSLRAREKNKIYNLKVLSDQALGRERKHRGRNSNTEINGEGRVQYILPSDQPISLEFYCCITCGACHDSMDELQLHLQTSHPTYNYVLETTSQGPLFRVAALRESTLSPRKALQLARAANPFSIQALISGDQNWAMSRLGPDGDEVFKSPTKNFLGRIQSGSPVSKFSKPPLRRPVKAASVSKVLVPNIPQPLFHPISKAKLKPGQEVPQNTPDITWLIQKHRESIADFSDVTAAEKEYIWEWDGYILRQNITSAAYFPRAWLNFVEEKAGWLARAQHRMLEFGKHSSVLLARDVLDDEDMQQAFRYINEARAKSAKGQSPHGEMLAADDRAKGMASTKQSPKVSQIRKSANGCTICQLPVIGPRLLLCSNTVRSPGV